MSLIEERVATLEKLLVLIMSNRGETRAAISEGFKKTDANFIAIHEKIDKLSAAAQGDFKNVNLKLESIQEEISKINYANDYQERINNL